MDVTVITEEQKSALRRIRRLRRLHYLFLAIAFPTFISAAVVIERYGSLWFWMVPISALVASAATRFMTTRSICPKCHKLFFRIDNREGLTAFSIPSQKECRHCGLNLYES